MQSSFSQNSVVSQNSPRPPEQNKIYTAGTYRPQSNLNVPTVPQFVSDNSMQSRTIVYTTKPANLVQDKCVSREDPNTPRNVLYRTLSASSSNLTTQNALTGQLPNAHNSQQQQQERPKSTDCFPLKNQHQNLVNLQHRISLNDPNQNSNQQSQPQSYQQNQHESNQFRQPQRVTNQATPNSSRFVNVVDISQMVNRGLESQQQNLDVNQNSINNHNLMQRPMTNQNQMQRSMLNQNKTTMPNNSMPVQRSQSFESLQQTQQIMLNTQIPSTSPRHPMPLQQSNSHSHQALNNQSHVQRQSQNQMQTNPNQVLDINFTNAPQNCSPRMNLQAEVERQNLQAQTKNPL